MDMFPWRGNKLNLFTCHGQGFWLKKMQLKHFGASLHPDFHWKCWKLRLKRFYHLTAKLNLTRSGTRSFLGTVRGPCVFLPYLKPAYVVRPPRAVLRKLNLRNEMIDIIPRQDQPICVCFGTFFRSENEKKNRIEGKSVHSTPVAIIKAKFGWRLKKWGEIGWSTRSKAERSQAVGSFIFGSTANLKHVRMYGVEKRDFFSRPVRRGTPT